MKNIGSGSRKSNPFDYDESEEGATLSDTVRRNESDTKNDFRIDEQFKKIIPPLQPHEYQFLEESIELQGVLEPIIVWKEENTIVDGHNRYEISQKHKKKCPAKKMSFSDKSEALLWIRKHQLERRNITDYTKYELIQGIKEQLQEIGKKKRTRKPTQIESVLTNNDKKDLDPHNTRKKVADLLGWAEGKVGYADVIFNKAPEEVKTTLRNGSETINRAYSSIRKKLKNDNKKECRTEEYAVIYVDNPADESFNMTLKLPLKETAAESSMLFIWCPVLALDRLIKKLPSWGFHYRNMFVWEETDNKTAETDGINSINHELLIVAEKGNVEIEKPCKRSSILSPEDGRINRSLKVLKMIEAMFPSQKKVLIGAVKREGWVTQSYRSNKNERITKKKTVKNESGDVPIEVDENVYLANYEWGISKSKEFQKKGLADYVFNIGTSCKYQCSYCYVPHLRMTKQFDANLIYCRKQTKEKGLAANEFSLYRPYDNIMKTLGKSLHTIKYLKGETLLLCTTVDPLPDKEYVKTLVDIIKEVVIRSALDVRVLTKSSLIVDVARSLKNCKGRVIYGVSTGTAHNNIAQFLEGKASPINERLKALYWLQDNGYRTFGMICPVAPFESDKQSVKQLVENIRPDKCEQIWVEPYNDKRGNFPIVISVLRKNGFDKEALSIEQIKGKKNRSAWFEYSKSLFNNFRSELKNRGVQDKLNYLQYYHEGEELNFKKEDSKWIKFLKMDKAGSKKNWR